MTKALFSAVAIVVALAGCASSSASAIDHSYGNSHSCDDVASTDTVAAEDDADGTSAINPGNDPATPALQTLVHKWIRLQNAFEDTQSDPSEQNSPKAATAEQDAHDAADVVAQWCTEHGF